MPLPVFETMPLAVFHQAFDDPGWIYEIKYDGFRALAYLENGQTRLVSRNGNVYKSFGNLCSQIAASLAATDAILDGEIVHLDTAGRPQFMSLLRRRSPQQFVAFDLLWLNGQDLRNRPLIERKRTLHRLVPRVSPVLYADYFCSLNRPG